MEHYVCPGYQMNFFSFILYSFFFSPQKLESKIRTSSFDSKIEFGIIVHSRKFIAEVCAHNSNVQFDSKSNLDFPCVVPVHPCFSKFLYRNSSNFNMYHSLFLYKNTVYKNPFTLLPFYPI